MWHDPIVEEVHAIRQALLKQHHGDAKAISLHGAQIAAELGLRYVEPRPRYFKGFDGGALSNAIVPTTQIKI
jgi:hypothetical protein